MRHFFTIVLIPILVVGIFPFSTGFAQKRGFLETRKIAQTPFVNGAYRALVIGNQKYDDPEKIWQNLKTPINGARAVAHILQKSYGFGHVTLLLNATRREMIRAFNKLVTEVGPNDSVLVYYAGHGYLRESTQEGYWIPSDAEGRDDSTYVPNTTIKTKLSIIAEKARHVLLVSDSCFSGALLRSNSRAPRGLDLKTERYYKKKAQRKSVQILAAGGVEFVDDNYKNTGHSPFTYFFLNELVNNDRVFLEATELSLQVARNVSINVDQTPETGVLQGAGHAGGEFFFLKTDLENVVIDRGEPEPPKSSIVDLPPLEQEKKGLSRLSMGLFTGGGLVALLALMNGQEANDLDSEAKSTAQSNPTRSSQLEAERDSAASSFNQMGLLSALVLGWAVYESGWLDSTSSQAGRWRVLPTLTAMKKGSSVGLYVLGRW